MTKLSGPMLPPASGSLPRQAVVLLHGYGSDGNDLIGLAPHWQAVLPDAVFVAPNGPDACQQLAVGFQWFDVSFDGDRLAKRQQGVVAARSVLVEFLEDLWSQSEITPENTILAGFSQGAMMALHVGLSMERSLMGVIAFSGAFLPPVDFGNAAFAKTPVCLVHGSMDQVVGPEHSAEAEAVLIKAGYDVHYHASRGMGHGIAPDGLDFATAFIETIAHK